MEKKNNDEEGFPSPPASDNNNHIVPPPPTPPSTRPKDNGDEEPQFISKSPLAEEIDGTTKTAAVTVSFRGIGKTKKKLSIANDENHQQQMESSSSMMLPGAINVGGISPRSSDQPSTPAGSNTGQVIRDPHLVVQVGTSPDPEIVAVLASDNDNHIEERIAQNVEERFRQTLANVVVADEVHDDKDHSSTYCGLKKRTLLSLVVCVVSLLLIVGGVVGGMLSSRAEVSDFVPTSAPTLGDSLLEELRSLKATSDEYLWQFSDPMTPQSQALEWMKNDTIAMSPDRSTRDVLQRYVLAVLFYATSGETWKDSSFYSSEDDVCSWNKGDDDVYGVYCQLDGKSVATLILSDNNLQGKLPWELALLSNLQLFNFSLNSLTGSIPNKLGQLRSLEDLDISENQLTGTIPTELGQLLSLASLVLHGNQLTGTIPTKLGQLLSLTHVAVQYNQLTGTIPTELGQLLSLSSLEIYSTLLTGTIPTELGQLDSLIHLDLGYNELIGTIPTELGQLLFLKNLDLGYNQLTGTIPIELSQLP